MVFRITRRWTAFALFAVATWAFACAESQNPASPSVGGDLLFRAVAADLPFRAVAAARLPPAGAGSP